MRPIAILYLLFYMLGMSAQKGPRALVGIETDLEGVYENAAIINKQIEFIMFRGDRLLEIDLLGFQTLQVGALEIPIHIENGDDFDFVLLKDLPLKEAYFNGNQGAVKNNYVFSKHLALKDLELNADFIKANEAVVIDRITTLKDSMLTVAKNLALSEQFLKDENIFWDAYLDYHTIFYKTLRKPVFSPFLTVPVSEMRYSGQNYLNEYYMGIPFYNMLGYHFYLTKLDQAATAREKREVLRTVEDSSMLYTMLDWMEYQVYNRHPNADVYKSLLYDYNDNYEIIEKLELVGEIHQKKREGMRFPDIYLRDIFNDVKLYKDFGSRRVALLLYSRKDPKIDTNLLLWNQFYIDTKGQFDTYITICLDVDAATTPFTEVTNKYGVVGTHFGVNDSIGQPLLYTIGQFVLPAVLTIEPSHTISNYKTLQNMFNYSLMYENPRANRFLPLLGAY